MENKLKIGDVTKLNLPEPIDCIHIAFDGPEELAWTILKMNRSDWRAFLSKYRRQLWDKTVDAANEHLVSKGD